MVANLRLATTESWRDRSTGERQENTEWHNIVVFGRLDEIAEKHLRKGAKVYIDGRIQTRKWKDRAGQDRYSTEIITQNLEMLDSAAASSLDTIAPDPNEPPF